MTMAAHNFDSKARAGRRALVALRVLVAVALLFFGARALWFHGFTTGSISTECLDLFTVLGDEARNYDVCQRARQRYEHDPIAQAFAKDAELRLRREAANR